MKAESQRHRSRTDALTDAFRSFLQTESSSSIILLVVTLAALGLANSSYAGWYASLWENNFTLRVNGFELTLNLHHWINDGLMAVFFLLVGLEIKREVFVGELSSFKKAILPVSTAVGGMLVPALIYTLFNAGTLGASGWGIPMATDIAFALGILMLGGSRVPPALKIMLLALAIVDDLGAVMVIALFYTSSLTAPYLLAAAAIFAALVVLNSLRIRHLSPYLLLGVVLWYCLLKGGVHATISGVLLAFCMPIRSKLDVDHFSNAALHWIDRFKASGNVGKDNRLTEVHQRALQALARLTRDINPPLQRLEYRLKDFTAFIIMPLFAFANAGLQIRADANAILHPVTLGCFLGLVLGKQIGIFFFAWLPVRFGWAEKPEGVTWQMVYATAMLGGIGFTMSLFIAELAFAERSLLPLAKLGILAGSLLSGILGYLLLRHALRNATPIPDTPPDL